MQMAPPSSVPAAAVSIATRRAPSTTTVTSPRATHRTRDRARGTGTATPVAEPPAEADYEETVPAVSGDTGTEGVTGDDVMEDVDATTADHETVYSDDDQAAEGEGEGNDDDYGEDDDQQETRPSPDTDDDSYVEFTDSSGRAMSVKKSELAALYTTRIETNGASIAYVEDCIRDDPTFDEHTAARVKESLISLSSNLSACTPVLELLVHLYKEQQQIRGRQERKLQLDRQRADTLTAPPAATSPTARPTAPLRAAVTPRRSAPPATQSAKRPSTGVVKPSQPQRPAAVKTALRARPRPAGVRDTVRDQVRAAALNFSARTAPIPESFLEEDEYDESAPVTQRVSEPVAKGHFTDADLNEKEVRELRERRENLVFDTFY